MASTSARLCLVIAASLWLSGCPRNVPQDKNSGKDYRYKGAKPIALEGGEGQARDIVTYPGGDRVDWKVLEIPKEQQGDLRIKLSWRAPRPGLDLAFQVYNGWFERIAGVKPDRSGNKRSKQVKVRGVTAGKYYIQVYAPRRMDAGRYTLTVRFRERKQPPSIDELADQIPVPPVLPAVPRPKTAEEVAAEEAEKLRLAEEARIAGEARAADEAKLAELNKPVYARIRRTQVATGGGVIITIDAGKNRGVDRGWVGDILRGDSKSRLPDGDFTIITITEREAVAKVKLSMDQVKANPRVELRRAP